MENYRELIPLSRHFFARQTDCVAHDLIGTLLVRTMGEKVLIGRIVETEAYGGSYDSASHAFCGPTKRNASMFGPVGHAYVYFIYGNHFSLNAVARLPGENAGGVLIRAVEPLVGIEHMRLQRGQVPDSQLTNGPGKLAQAFGITKELYGIDLTEPGVLYLAHNVDEKVLNIQSSQRIGITKAQELRWRFFAHQNTWVTPSILNR